MYIPKIIFKEISIYRETDVLFHFLFDRDLYWRRCILQKHPDLKGIFSIKSEKAQSKFLRHYITAYRTANQGIIEKSRIRFANEWKKIEKSAFTVLSDIMEISWPKERKFIKAFISINPISPRFLREWGFSLPYDINAEHAFGIIMHECCHLLYFKKWQLLFKHSHLKTFEKPHIEWVLSELIAPIILNDSRVKKILKYGTSFYSDHEKIRIKGKSAPQYFSLLYDKNLKKNGSFEDFLRQAYVEIKKYKDKFH